MGQKQIWERPPINAESYVPPAVRGGIVDQRRSCSGGDRFWRCVYCGNPPGNNKMGRWGRACSGCKGSLTRMLRSGKYGPTYARATADRLRRMVYDHLTGKWVDGTDGVQGRLPARH
jgi:hypothetical protein